MNDEPRTTDERALDALRALPVESSDIARARSRAAFVSGTSVHPRHPRAAAVAAIATLLLLWIGSRPTATWTVRGIDGPAVATRGEAPLDVRVAHDFVAGTVRTGPETEIEIERGPLHLRIRPGTEARIPAPPGRWFDRARTIEVTRGEVFGSSGDQGAGFPLVLRTPEATARLTGTTFAVFRTDDATCFCLYRGGIEVTPRGGESFDLPVGHRVFVYDDERPPSIQPLDAGETMKLRMIDDAALEN